MKIIVEERVHQAIDSFYDAAILKHWHTLSYEIVERKKDRLYDGLESLVDYATIFPKARLKQEWIEKGWQEVKAIKNGKDSSGTLQDLIDNL